MDLLRLGLQSRKTGIKPKDNLTKDKYDMEDVDEFFEEATWSETRDIPSWNKTLEHPSTQKLSTKKTLGMGKIRSANKSESSPANPSTRSARSLRGIASSSSLRDGPEETNMDFSGYTSYPDTGQDTFDHIADIANEDSVNVSSASPSPPLDDSVGDETSNQVEDISVIPQKLSPVDSPKNYPKFLKKMASTSNKRTVKKTGKPDSDHAVENDHDESRPSPTNALSSDSDDYTDYDNDATQGTNTGTYHSMSNYNSTQKSSISNPSPLPSPPPDGLRRSKRTKIAPLAYWRNERIIYSRADDASGDPNSTLISDIQKVPLQEIFEVVHVPEATKGSSKRKRKSKGEISSKIKLKDDSYDYASDPEIEGSEWYKDTYLETDVFESEDTKKLRVVAWSSNGGNFQSPPAAKNGQQVVENFQVAPLFDADSEMIAAGLLDFPFEGFKSLRTTGESLFIFHVAKGLIEVTLNSERFVVTRGCSFEIPRYNIYSFKNIGNGSARLFFVQCQLSQS